MNEITRIHIAKTAYDIEIAAKKQLEKYIKSLEAYTQDSDVLTDIEIRMTELLNERGVKAGGVISSDDVAALRKQLGEPYEFADGEGDIAVGPVQEAGSRRIYRSVDDAVLGGVLSGVAAYFNFNAVWARLGFIVLMFISFGFAALLYIVLWVILPPARTATEKLQLAGKDVTLESIKELNADEEKAPENRVAPVLQRVLSVVLGAGSAAGAVLTFILVAWLVIAAATMNGQFMDLTNGFTGLGDGNAWIVWLVFGIVVFGLMLLTALFGLIAYAFFARKLTKRMVISGIIITVLGITSVAATLAISTTQSWRVANETRSMMRETSANLPKEFSTVNSVKLSVKAKATDGRDADFFAQYAAIRYVVDEGPARYELTALPSAKPVVKVEGQAASITLEVPSSFRNSFVQPILTVYGPAIATVVVDSDSGGSQLSYNGTTQDALTVDSLHENSQISVAGSYQRVSVKGLGSVALDESTIQSLEVQAKSGLQVSAGTVRELNVTQPDVCAGGVTSENTSVRLYGITSGAMTYNGQSLPAETHRTGCASVVIEPSEDESMLQ